MLRYLARYFLFFHYSGKTQLQQEAGLCQMSFLYGFYFRKGEVSAQKSKAEILGADNLLSGL